MDGTSRTVTVNDGTGRTMTPRRHYDADRGRGDSAL
jgi:hypothetical protein